MTCEEARRQIPALVRDALPEDVTAAVREHTEGCGACGRRLEQKRQLALMTATVEAVRDVPQSAELDEDRRDEIRRTRPLRLALAILPAILVAAGIFLWLTRPWEGPQLDPYRPVAPIRTTPPAISPTDPAGRLLRLTPRATAIDADATPRPRLRDLALRSDVVVIARVTDVARERVQVRVEDVLLGNAAALDPATVGDPRATPIVAAIEWLGVTRVVLFVRREAGGTPALVAGHHGCVPLPMAGTIDERLVRSLIAGDEPDADALDALAESGGVPALARLEPELSLRGRIGETIVGRLARDSLRRFQTAADEKPRHAHLRDLALLLRIADAPPLDISIVRGLHPAFLELPSYEPRNRIAHLRAVATDDPEWALRRLREVLDVGLSYMPTESHDRCPPEILEPLRLIGELDAAEAQAAATEVLLTFPSRGIARDVLDLMLDVAPDATGESVISRAREETWDDREHVRAWYAELIARVRTPEATELLSQVVPWILEFGSVDRRRDFVAALRRAGPDGPAQALLPDFVARAQQTRKGEILAFLLRCRHALGAPFEPLREHAAELLVDPAEVSMVARLDLIRAVQEITGERVLEWQRPGDEEITAAAAELARRLR